MEKDKLLNRESIYTALAKADKIHYFISSGTIRANLRAPNDTTGASQAFDLDKFASGFYGYGINKDMKWYEKLSVWYNFHSYGILIGLIILATIIGITGMILLSAPMVIISFLALFILQILKEKRW